MLYARSLLVRQGCHRALPAAKAAGESHFYDKLFVCGIVPRPEARKGANGPDRFERPARNQ